VVVAGLVQFCLLSVAVLWVVCGKDFVANLRRIRLLIISVNVQFVQNYTARHCQEMESA